MVFPECTFLWWELFIPSFKTITYVVDKQSDICRRYLLLLGLCVPSVKSTTYVCNMGLILLSVSLLLFVVTSTKDYKTNPAISNLNQTFWNKSTQQIKSTTSSTDLCFNKKFEQEKKRLYKISISKSIDVDTYYVLYVIIVPESDVLSNIIFFLTSQKGRSIASVNYLKVKNDVPDRNQIQTAPNFLFLSS